MMDKLICLIISCCAIFMISSCSTSKNATKKDRQSSIEIIEYKYRGVQVPDSLKSIAVGIEKMSERFSKGIATYYISSETKFVEIGIDSLHQSSTKTIFDLTSSNIIALIQSSEGTYYEILIDSIYNQNNQSLFSANSIMEETKEFMTINGISCQRYDIMRNGEFKNMSIYINSKMPVEYFKGIKGAPKGIPYRQTYEIMPGVKIVYEAKASDKVFDNKADIFHIDTSLYKSKNEFFQEQLSENKLIVSKTNYPQRQTVYLSVRNDTIVLGQPNCLEIENFDLKINPEGAFINYIFKRSKSETSESSKGPIFSMKEINSTMTSAKFRDEYNDTYSIYIENSTERESFIKIWKSRRKSAYLWESFSPNCLENSAIKSLIFNISQNLLNIAEPKIFIVPNSDFDKVPWVKSISNHAFSKN